MNEIKVTILATLRPGILRRTLDSFAKLFGDTACAAVINVDPIGEKCQQNDVLDVCWDHFDIVFARTPDEPNMNFARKWLWEQAGDARYVFNLEDDWVYHGDITLADMVAIMDAEPDLGQLGFTWQRDGLDETGRNTFRYHHHIAHWNGRYYEWQPEDRRGVGLVSSPGLLRGDLVRAITPLLRTDTNVNMQFHGRRNGRILPEVFKWRYGICGKPGDGAWIRDIGREWMANQDVWMKDRGYAMMGWKRRDDK